MDIQLRENLSLYLYGFAGTVPHQNYGEVGIRLSGRMWDIVKKNNLANNGINVWVYNNQAEMFAGVELNPRPASYFGLEEKSVSLKKYAWCKHIGPYELLFETNKKMRAELQRLGLKYGPPSLEIYGHHGPDSSKLETEIIYSID